MSKRNKKISYEKYKELEEQLQQKERQLQNMDVGFITFIKSRIKKFLNCFKIKNLDLFKNYKITKLKIVLPSLCLLFVVGLVYFFAFAEPADQLPQNQTFLNLAHSHINASTTAPTTYTSTSTHDTQAELAAGTGSGWMATASNIIRPSAANGETSSSESGLVSLWHMNNNWLDAKGTNNGTRYGTGIPFETTSPKLGTASGKFNGVDDYVTINPDILNNAGAATIEAWIKLNAYAPTSQSPIVVDTTTTQFDFQLIVLPDNNTPHKLRFSVWNTAGTEVSANSFIDIPLNAWAHVVGVYDGASVMVYINGMQNGSIGSLSGNIYSLSNDCRIGADAWDSPKFNGLIDEVAIYNRALSAAEIQQHYEAGSPAETSFYRSPRFDLGVKT
ncbi:MAG: LamG domain-containing protein, partial [Patescibacteria group bacterium]